MTSKERVESSPIGQETLIIPEDLRTRKEPPESSVRAIFQNGTGKMIGMKLSLSNLEDLPILQRLEKEKEGLERRRDEKRIEKTLQAILKNRHGGGTISKSKRTKSVKALLAEQKTISAKIASKGERIDKLRNQLSKQLKNVLAKSNPFSPLTLKINGDIEIVQGKPLSEAEQVWWEYVRERGQEGPWQFIAARKDQNFLDVQEYFLSRLETKLARSPKAKERAEARFEAITQRLDQIPESDYAPLLPHIQEATDYAATYRLR